MYETRTFRLTALSSTSKNFVGDDPSLWVAGTGAVFFFSTAFPASFSVPMVDCASLEFGARGCEEMSELFGWRFAASSKEEGTCLWDRDASLGCECAGSGELEHRWPSSGRSEEDDIVLNSLPGPILPNLTVESGWLLRERQYGCEMYSKTWSWGDDDCCLLVMYCRKQPRHSHTQPHKASGNATHSRAYWLHRAVQSPRLACDRP